jgi:hypothetical protein
MSSSPSLHRSPQLGLQSRYASTSCGQGNCNTPKIERGISSKTYRSKYIKAKPGVKGAGEIP